MQQLPEVMRDALKEQNALDAGPQKDDMVFTGLVQSAGHCYPPSPRVAVEVLGSRMALHGNEEPLTNLPEGEYVVLVTIRKVPVRS